MVEMCRKATGSQGGLHGCDNGQCAARFLADRSIDIRENDLGRRRPHPGVPILKAPSWENSVLNAASGKRHLFTVLFIGPFGRMSVGFPLTKGNNQ